MKFRKRKARRIIRKKKFKRKEIVIFSERNIEMPKPKKKGSRYERIKHLFKDEKVICVKECCAKCSRESNIEKHHILPKCHFQDGPLLSFCSDCHLELERFINSVEPRIENGAIRGKIGREEYYLLTINFLARGYFSFSASEVY